MILKYSKVRTGVFTPIRANPSDAGLDLRYSPDTSKLGDYDNWAILLTLRAGYRFHLALRF